MIDRIQFTTRLIQNGRRIKRASNLLFQFDYLHRPSLFKTMAKSFGLPFCLAAILKLIHDICQFIGPVMLEKITLYLGDPEETKLVVLIVFVHS